MAGSYFKKSEYKKTKRHHASSTYLLLFVNGQKTYKTHYYY